MQRKNNQSDRGNQDRAYVYEVDSYGEFVHDGVKYCLPPEEYAHRTIHAQHVVNDGRRQLRIWEEHVLTIADVPGDSSPPFVITDLFGDYAPLKPLSEPRQNITVEQRDMSYYSLTTDPSSGVIAEGHST